MSFWLGTIHKHRDFMHNSFFEHEMESGGNWRLAEFPVEMNIDPITDDIPVPWDWPYYPVHMQMHNADRYMFFVPAKVGKRPPERSNIKKYIDDLLSSPRPGGSRDIYELVGNDYHDYIDDLRGGTFGLTNQGWGGWLQ